MYYQFTVLTKTIYKLFIHLCYQLLYCRSIQPCRSINKDSLTKLYYQIISFYTAGALTKTVFRTFNHALLITKRKKIHLCYQQY